MKTIILLFLSVTTVFSQGNFGVEIRSSQNITFNSGEIGGGILANSTFIIMEERSVASSSYSIGLMYDINAKNTIKLHIGSHRNGRNIDVTENFPNLLSSVYNDVNLWYNYLQVIPSYTYNITSGRSNIPIELGVAINKRIREGEIIFMGINEYNYDLRLSSGYSYNLFDNFSIGASVVFSHAINEYQDKLFISGQYKPMQFGIELSAQYYFRKISNSGS